MAQTPGLSLPPGTPGGRVDLGTLMWHRGDGATFWGSLRTLSPLTVRITISALDRDRWVLLPSPPKVTGPPRPLPVGTFSVPARLEARW